MTSERGRSNDPSLYSNRDPDAINSLVVCFGEMLVDFVSSVSGVSLAEAPTFEKAPGGAPANVAVGISRLGGSSAFIGKITIMAVPEVAREGIMSVWDQADVIKVSEDEITFLTGGDDGYDDNVVFEKLFHPNLKLLLHFKGRVDGVKVKPLDAMGAGDAFEHFSDEKRLREALVFANACGAVVVTKKGAIAAMPSKGEVKQILKLEA
ncbi:hypothetical protein R6Q57_005287 [Mikania cordata]